jgi:tripartite-type tricarboxylate transporter receptor subunit TctC
MRKSACQFFCYVLAALAVAAAASAQPYPNKPVRLIVPYAPGGGTDILARLMAQRLTESLGQAVVIENRAGADGIVGSGLVAKAPADGYTMLLASSSHAINPTVHAKIPYDTLKEFACVSQTASQQLVLVVHPSLPVNSVSELIAYAMANPDTLDFASSSKATQLPMELFNTMAGIRMTHIPYKGSGPALNDLVGGQVKVSFGGAVSFTPHIKSGRLRALAIGDSKRSAFLPDLPTAAEAGVPGYEATIWTGLYVPVATPREIVKRLNADVAKIVHLPEIKERLQAQGSDPVGSSPEECDAFMKSEVAKWAKVAKDAGIKPEG